MYQSIEWEYNISWDIPTFELPDWVTYDYVEAIEAEEHDEW